MAFKSRTFLIMAVMALASMTIFAYDSALRANWASLFFGVIASLGLMGMIGASHGSGLVVLEPASHRAGPGGKEDLSGLLDQIPTPLVRLAPHGRPEAINRAARELFQTDDIIISNADALIVALEAGSAGSNAIASFLGRQYAVSVAEVAWVDGYARLATLTDVQMEIHKAEASALRDTLHILSHEIMNSLTPVASLAEVAKACLSQAPQDVAAATDALDTLLRRASDLTRFIEAYKSLARLPDPDLRPSDPARLVEDIMALFMRSPANSHIRFEISMPDSLPRLELDEALVSQAIINVVTNAIEATANLPQKPRIGVSVLALHQDVSIRISDNGEGVPETIRSSLFNSFTTTKPKGTGTGLNLARQIAWIHGGNLQLEASLPGATTFVFTFPVRS